MQTSTDVFVSPWAIKMKIAGKLVGDSKQVLDKTKLLSVKRKQTPP